MYHIQMSESVRVECDTVDEVLTFVSLIGCRATVELAPLGLTCYGNLRRARNAQDRERVAIFWQQRKEDHDGNDPRAVPAGSAAPAV